MLKNNIATIAVIFGFAVIIKKITTLENKIKIFEKVKEEVVKEEAVKVFEKMKEVKEEQDTLCKIYMQEIDCKEEEEEEYTRFKLQEKEHHFDQDDSSEDLN